MFASLFSQNNITVLYLIFVIWSELWRAICTIFCMYSVFKLHLLSSWITTVSKTFWYQVTWVKDKVLVKVASRNVLFYVNEISSVSQVCDGFWICFHRSGFVLDTSLENWFIAVHISWQYSIISFTNQTALCTRLSVLVVRSMWSLN